MSEYDSLIRKRIAELECQLRFKDKQIAALNAELRSAANAVPSQALSTLDSAIDCCGRSPRPCEQARAAKMVQAAMLAAAPKPEVKP